MSKHHPFDFMDEPQLRSFFSVMAGCIENGLPQDTGFILLVSPMGKSGVCQYVGNVDRECAMKWMKEAYTRMEQRDDVPREDGLP